LLLRKRLFLAHNEANKVSACYKKMNDFDKKNAIPSKKTQDFR